jgi:hypothetical protein
MGKLGGSGRDLGNFVSQVQAVFYAFKEQLGRASNAASFGASSRGGEHGSRKQRSAFYKVEWQWWTWKR